MWSKCKGIECDVLKFLLLLLLCTRLCPLLLVLLALSVGCSRERGVVMLVYGMSEVYHTWFTFASAKRRVHRIFLLVLVPNFRAGCALVAQILDIIIIIRAFPRDQIHQDVHLFDFV